MLLKYKRVEQSKQNKKIIYKLYIQYINYKLISINHNIKKEYVVKKGICSF